MNYIEFSGKARTTPFGEWCMQKTVNSHGNAKLNFSFIHNKVVMFE